MTMIVILVIMVDLITKENIMKRKKYHDNKFDNDDDSDIGNNDGPNNKGGSSVY